MIVRLARLLAVRLQSHRRPRRRSAAALAVQADGDADDRDEHDDEHAERRFASIERPAAADPTSSAARTSSAIARRARIAGRELEQRRELRAAADCGSTSGARRGVASDHDRRRAEEAIEPRLGHAERRRCRRARARRLAPAASRTSRKSVRTVPLADGGSRAAGRPLQSSRSHGSRELRDPVRYGFVKLTFGTCLRFGRRLEERIFLEAEHLRRQVARELPARVL